MDIDRRKLDALAGRGGIHCYCCGGRNRGGGKDRRLVRAIRRTTRQAIRINMKP